MGIQEIVDLLPPRRDVIRIARYFGSLRRPARSELVFYGIAGMLIGAGLALMFAPARGSELRGQIRGRFDEYWSSATEPPANGHDPADRVT
jgi:hypothetical protein